MPSSDPPLQVPQPCILAEPKAICPTPALFWVKLAHLDTHECCPNPAAEVLAQKLLVHTQIHSASRSRGVPWVGSAVAALPQSGAERHSLSSPGEPKQKLINLSSSLKHQFSSALPGAAARPSCAASLAETCTLQRPLCPWQEFLREERWLKGCARHPKS